MLKETIQLNDEMYCTVEPCPVDYFGSDSKSAERVITYWNDQKVSTWDIYLSDDTRYTMLFEAEPEFQNGRWIELAKTYWPNSLDRFSRQYIVWLNSNGAMVARETEVKTLLEHFSSNNVMKSNTVLAQGMINKIIPLEE